MGKVFSSLRLKSHRCSNAADYFGDQDDSIIVKLGENDRILNAYTILGAWQKGRGYVPIPGCSILARGKDLLGNHLEKKRCLCVTGNYQEYGRGVASNFYKLDDTKRERIIMELVNDQRKTRKLLDTERSMQQKPFCLVDASQSMTNQAVAVIKGDRGVRGIISFYQPLARDDCVIFGEIRGLVKGSHGLNIHHIGDSTNGCMSAGPHFNPFGKKHGGPGDENRHVGDLGNVKSGDDGVARVSLTDKFISIHGATNILGLHVSCCENADDLGKGSGDKKKESQRTGNCGASVASGEVVIGRKMGRSMSS